MGLVTFAITMVELEITFTKRTTGQTLYDMCVVCELCMKHGRPQPPHTISHACSTPTLRDGLFC